MKVSPEYLIQLSHRVNTLHREKEKFINRPRSKDRVNSVYVYQQAQVKRQGEYFICVLTGPGQRTG